MVRRRGVGQVMEECTAYVRIGHVRIDHVRIGHDRTA